MNKFAAHTPIWMKARIIFHARIRRVKRRWSSLPMSPIFGKLGPKHRAIQLEFPFAD